MFRPRLYLLHYSQPTNPLIAGQGSETIPKSLDGRLGREYLF